MIYCIQVKHRRDTQIKENEMAISSSLIKGQAIMGKMLQEDGFTNRAKAILNLAQANFYTKTENMPDAEIDADEDLASAWEILDILNW
jgi:hypothetical protein